MRWSRLFRCLAAALLGVPALGAADAIGACDLKLTFSAPPAGELPGGVKVTWKLLVQTQSAGCGDKELQIKLMRYAGSTASGSGTQVGGSAAKLALETMRALIGTLREGGVTLAFEENPPPTAGTYTYAAVFASPFNDDNNSNHRPTRTVTFKAPAQAAPGPPDLRVESVRVLQNAKVGRCTPIEISVKNDGGALNQITTAVLVIQRAGAGTQVSDRRNIPFSAFSAGQTQTRKILDLNFADPGAWTVQVVADSEQKVEEGNEKNNISTQTVTPQEKCLNPTGRPLGSTP